MRDKPCGQAVNALCECSAVVAIAMFQKSFDHYYYGFSSAQVRCFLLRTYFSVLLRFGFDLSLGG